MGVRDGSVKRVGPWRGAKRAMWRKRTLDDPDPARVKELKRYQRRRADLKRRKEMEEAIARGEVPSEKVVQVSDETKPVEVPEQMQRLALTVFDAAHGIPTAAQTVIALRSFGLSNREIADRLGYADTSGVRKLLERYDPNRVAERGDAMRRLVLSCMFETLVFNALTSLTPQDILDLPADKRVAVATSAVKAIRGLNAKPIALAKQEEELIKAMQDGLEVIDVVAEVRA